MSMKAKLLENGNVQVELTPDHPEHAKLALLCWARSKGRQKVKAVRSVTVEHMLPAGPAPGVDEGVAIATRRATKAARNGAPVNRLKQLVVAVNCRKKEWTDSDTNGDFPEAKPVEDTGSDDEAIDKGAIGDTVASVSSFLARRWEQLEGRYGRKAALAMAVSMIATLPLPGNITAIVAAAEAIRGIAGWMNKDLTDVEKAAVLKGEFREQDHPRADDGKFGSGGSGSPAAGDNEGKPKDRPKPEGAKKTGKVKEPSDKAKRAKAAHHMVDKDIQRYAEEHNEPAFAKSVGGVSFPNNEPIDVAVPGKGGAVAHGLELKTMVSNKANKITMKRSAMERKIDWEKRNKATFHTVVLDDGKVFNAKGPGQHGDEKDRVIWYRRGAGSFRVGSMHKVKNVAELKRLMAMKDEALPGPAQPSVQWLAMKRKAGKR